MSGSVVAAMLVTSIPVAGDQRVIRCEGGFWRSYKYCGIETDGAVEISRELSSRRCEQWRSWGYDRHGVWVDRGCRAEFIVGRRSGVGAAAVIGAIAGAALMAAILGGRDTSQHPGEPPADWAVGKFHGFSPYQNRDYDLRIDRNGELNGESEGDRVGGFIERDRMHLGRAEFQLHEEDWGFRATQADNRENVIYFRRQ